MVSDELADGLEAAFWGTVLWLGVSYILFVVTI